MPSHSSLPKSLLVTPIASDLSGQYILYTCTIEHAYDEGEKECRASIPEDHALGVALNRLQAPSLRVI